MFRLVLSKLINLLSVLQKLGVFSWRGSRFASPPPPQKKASPFPRNLRYHSLLCERKATQNWYSRVKVFHYWGQGRICIDVVWGKRICIFLSINVSRLSCRWQGTQDATKTPWRIHRTVWAHNLTKAVWTYCMSFVNRDCRWNKFLVLVTDGGVWG